MLLNAHASSKPGSRLLDEVFWDREPFISRTLTLLLAFVVSAFGTKSQISVPNNAHIHGVP